MKIQVSGITVEAAIRCEDGAVKIRLTTESDIKVSGSISIYDARQIAHMLAFAANTIAPDEPGERSSEEA